MWILRGPDQAVDAMVSSLRSCSSFPSEEPQHNLSNTPVCVFW